MPTPQDPFAIQPFVRGPVENPDTARATDQQRKAFDALLREAQDGRIPRVVNQPIEVMTQQARQLMLDAGKTEVKPGIEGGFPMSVRDYKRAIDLADKIDQTEVQKQIAALRMKPSEARPQFDGKPLTSKEDILICAKMLPTATRINFALACFRSGDQQAIAYGKQLLDEAAKRSPEIKTDAKLIEAIQKAVVDGQKKVEAGGKTDVPPGKVDVPPGKTDNYDSYGGVPGEAALRGKSNEPAVIKRGPFSLQADTEVSPPPDFAAYYAMKGKQPIPKPPGGDGQKPPGGDQQKPPGGEGEKPPGGDGQKPPTNPDDRDGQRERKDEKDTWSFIENLAKLAAAGGALFGAYKLIQNYMQRYDDVRRATENGRVVIDPERAKSEFEVRRKGTGEELKWDPESKSYKDGKGEKVEAKDLDIEYKIRKPPDGVDKATWEAQEKARLKGQLDLQLRGRENLGKLLDDVKVVDDSKITAEEKAKNPDRINAERGTRKTVVIQADGKEGELLKTTQDGKLEVKRANGTVETIEPKAGDRVEVRSGDPTTAARYSQRDAVSDLAYQMGRKADLDFAKDLAQFGKNTTHTQMAAELERAAKSATGELKTQLEQQAADLRKNGNTELSRIDRANRADALRAEADRLGPGEKADALRATADKIMPRDVGKEVRKQEKEAADKKAEEDRLAKEAADKKAEEDRLAKEAADKKAEEDRLAKEAADKKAEEDRLAKEAADKKAEEDRLAKEAADKKAEEDRLAKEAADKKAEEDRLAKEAADKKAEEDRLAKEAADKKAEEDRLAKEAADKKAEEDRLAKEAADKKAEEDRLAKEAADKKAEEDRLAKEAADKKAEEDRLAKEAADKKAEEDRLAKEAADKKAEEDRLAKEAADKKAEEDRLAKEAADKKAEEDRLAKEAADKKAEEDRLAKEAADKKAEADRLAKEAADKKAEEDRLAKEAADKKAEADRLAKEAADKKAEEDRLAKEAADKKAEEDRLAKEEADRKLAEAKAAEAKKEAGAGDGDGKETGRKKTSGRNRGPGDAAPTGEDRGRVETQGDVTVVTDKTASPEVLALLEKWKGNDKVLEKDLGRAIAKVTDSEKRKALEGELAKLTAMEEGAPKDAAKRAMAECIVEARKGGKGGGYDAVLGRIAKVGGTAGIVIAVGMLAQVLLQNESGYQNYRPAPATPDFGGGT